MTRAPNRSRHVISTHLSLRREAAVCAWSARSASDLQPLMRRDEELVPVVCQKSIAGSCGSPAVEVEQSAESLAALDRRVAVGWSHCLFGWREQAVDDALVVTLVVIMLDVLRHRTSQVILPERHQLAQALDLIDSTKRSGTEFRLGLRAGSRRHFTPAAASTPRNSAVNSGSRS